MSHCSHCSFRVALRSINPFLPPLINTRSRKMATQPGHSQDATTTGEEIASTTIPPKGPQPEHRNACTLPRSVRSPHPVLTYIYSQRSHVSQGHHAKESTSLKYSSIRPGSNNHLSGPRRSRRLHFLTCLFPCF